MFIYDEICAYLRFLSVSIIIYTHAEVHNQLTANQKN